MLEIVSAITSALGQGQGHGHSVGLPALNSELLQKVGCDWTVDSDAVEDRCGVCRGDGSQCDTVSGTYNRPDGYGNVPCQPSQIK